jgi:hypothetical protein
MEFASVITCTGNLSIRSSGSPNRSISALLNRWVGFGWITEDFMQGRMASTMTVGCGTGTFGGLRARPLKVHFGSDGEGFPGVVIGNRYRGVCFRQCDLLFKEGGRAAEARSHYASRG